jgi:hypothetical protein
MGNAAPGLQPRIISMPTTQILVKARKSQELPWRSAE